MSAARRRFAGAMSTMALLIAVIGVAPAWAAEPLVLDQDQILYGEEGSTQELAELTIDAERIGAVCTLRVHAENQFSVHPGNDLLVTTGGVQTVIEDVEAEPDGDRDLSAGIVLGPILVVELRFGPHQVSSMGFDLSVDCATTAGIIVQPDPCDVGSSTDASTSTSTTAAPSASATDCQEPTPVTEVAVALPTLPQPCGTTADAGDGSLTVSGEGCEQPTTTTTAAPTTTIAAPPTTAAVVQSTTTAAPATTGPTPTVKGLQITRGLPQTPAAAPVQASPAYTG